MNATTTVSWSPEGAVRTAIRRMTKHGKSPAAIANVLQQAHTHPDKAKGNIGGAIKRMKKHGISAGNVVKAIANVLNDYIDKYVEPIEATHVTVTSIEDDNGAVSGVERSVPVAVKAKKVDNRTPAEKQHAKARMAYLRSCRKGNVKLAYVEPINTKRESDLPVATMPTASKLKAPIVLNSFDELDTLLNDLGIR